VTLIQEALLENQVIFFRDQDMSHEQLIRFGRYFGTLYTHPNAAKEQSGKQPYVSTLLEYPEIIRVYADENSIKVAGETLHSDVSSEVEPPMGSILRLEELPEVGGDTLFASMYAAFDAFSKEMQEFLCSLTAIHDGAHAYGRKNPDRDRQFVSSEHPVIRTHPVTGRQALFVSTSFTRRIVQLTQSESDALLIFLLRHIEKPAFQCRFRWQKNSVAFWDNRCTLHQAQWDYFPNRRVGYRVQLIGDRPFFRRTNEVGG